MGGFTGLETAFRTLTVVAVSVKIEQGLEIQEGNTLSRVVVVT